MATAVIGGSATAAMTEVDVRAGGKVITITLVGDTWISEGTMFKDDGANVWADDNADDWKDNP